MHPRSQLATSAKSLVDRTVVVPRDRVVQRGDPSRCHHAQRRAHRGEVLVEGRLRHVLLHQADRAVDQVAGRVALSVAHDRPVDRIGGARRHARDLQRPGVHQGVVAVGGPDDDRALRLQHVQDLLHDRQARREHALQIPVGHRQPTVRLLIDGVVEAGLDHVAHLVDRERQVPQAALLQQTTRVQRVDVPVLDARHHGTAGEIDDLGPRADPVPGAGDVADVDDASVRDRHRLGDATPAIHRDHGSTEEDRVRRSRRRGLGQRPGAGCQHRGGPSRRHPQEPSACGSELGHRHPPHRSAGDHRHWPREARG